MYLYLQALLLLTQLTKGNTNLQKIVAFENAFERLLDIVRDEGNSDGGIFVIKLYSLVEKLKVFSIHKWVKKGFNCSLMLHLFNFPISILYLLLYGHYHVFM